MSVNMYENICKYECEHVCKHGQALWVIERVAQMTRMHANI
jgi:hypothetical protein